MSSSTRSAERRSDEKRSAIENAAVAAAVDVASALVPSGDPPPADLAPPPAPAGDPALLDEELALRAIRATDLSDCRYRGAPVGFGRARVTFRADGRVTQVSIESPQNLSADAANCIGDRLGDAVAPPFAGPPVDLYGTFYVR